MKIYKKFIFTLTIFVIFALFFPFHHTYAGIFSSLVGIATSVPSLIISFVIFVCGLLSSIFAGIAAWILAFVLSPDFISLSYTNLTNPIIKIGFGLTQGLANIILVFVLIYIALAIILRLAGYETKKLLINFLITALLINFSPVICGLIVDASNILMNHFTKPLIGEGGLKSLVVHLQSIWKMFSANLKFETVIDSGAQASLIFKLISAVIFYLLLGLILFLYAGIIIIRYIAIWIAVILSPIAFVCRLLPSNSFGRKIWDMWWSQFIQWSIIGISKMFFLYLGIQIMVQAEVLFKSKMGGEYGWFDYILPYVVPLAFLYIGYILSFQSSAMGASAVMDLTKKYGKKGAGYAWSGTKFATRKALTSDWAEKKGIKDRLARQTTAELPSFKGKGIGGKVLTGVGYATGIIPAAWLVRRGAGQVTLGLTEEEIKDVKDSQEKSKGQLPQKKLAGIRDDFMLRKHGRAVGKLIQAIEEEQIGDLKKLGLKDEEIIKAGREALKIDPKLFKKFRNAFPHLAQQMVEGFSDNLKGKSGIPQLTAEEQRAKITIPMKIMATISSEFIPKIDEEFLLSEDGQAFFHSNLASASQLSALLESGPRKVKEKFIEKAQKYGIEHYEEINPGIANFLKSNPGIRLMGIEIPAKGKKEEVF